MFDFLTFCLSYIKIMWVTIVEPEHKANAFSKSFHKPHGIEQRKVTHSLVDPHVVISLNC